MKDKTKGERLRYLRENKCLTLDDVSKLIGKTRQTIFKYEHDIVTNIPSDVVQQLASLYNTTPGFIMGWDMFPYFEISNVDWVNKFKDNLRDIWDGLASQMASADYEDSGAKEVERLINNVLSGEIALTFIVACEIADKLGVSLDELVGREEYEKAALDYENGLNELELQLLNLLKQLSPEQKEFLLVQLEALVKRNKGSEETPF